MDIDISRELDWYQDEPLELEDCNVGFEYYDEATRKILLDKAKCVKDLDKLEFNGYRTHFYSKGLKIFLTACQGENCKSQKEIKQFLQ